MKHLHDASSHDRDGFPEISIAELMLFDLALKLEDETFADNYVKAHNLNSTSPDYPMSK